MSQPTPFAKLFDFDDIGQVLIFKANHDETDAPSIVTMMDGNDLIRPTTEGSYASEDARDAAFDKIDRDAAHEAGSKLHEMLADLSSALS